MATLGPFPAVQELGLNWSPAKYNQLVAQLYAARPGTAWQVRVTQELCSLVPRFNYVWLQRYLYATVFIRQLLLSFFGPYTILYRVIFLTCPP